MNTFSVQEFPVLLRRLLRQYEGTKGYDRLLMLLMFREDPSASNRDISRKIQVPESTVRRWKAIYNKEGIPGLLNMGKEEEEHFQELLTLPAFSLPLPAAPPEKLIAFLNNLPTTSDSVKWSRAMRELLVSTFDEIDYALVNVRVNFQPYQESDINESPSMIYRQDVFKPGYEYVPAVRWDTPYSGPKWKKLLEEGKRNGFAFEKYHPAIGFDYYIGENGYIGCIVLFREKNKHLISDQTLHLFEQCRPFLAKVLLYHTFSLQNEHPGVRLFNDITLFIEADPPLTMREREVTRLLLLGHSYEDAADLLFITKSTMISHVRNIYRKTNVTKLSELFGRIFTPNLVPKKRDEKDKDDADGES